MDVVLPGLDGWQVLERLRQDDGTVRVPVLFISAQDLVEKPPESQVLLATVGEGLKISQLLRCSLALPELLLTPADGPGPERLQTGMARSALEDTGQPLVLEPNPLP